MKGQCSLSLPAKEKLFLLAAIAAAAVSVGLAFCFAVPFAPQRSVQQVQPAPMERALWVDLNTADVEALCTLPGIGEAKARAIVEYRLQNGAFEQLSDVLAVSGVTEQIVDSWEGQAYVSEHAAAGLFAVHPSKGE